MAWFAGGECAIYRVKTGRRIFCGRVKGKGVADCLCFLGHGSVLNVAQKQRRGGGEIGFGAKCGREKGVPNAKVRYPSAVSN